MADGVTAGWGGKFIRIVLAPHEALEYAPLEERERSALHSGEIPLEREGLQPVRVIEQGEFGGELFSPDLLLAQKREAALHQPAVEADPVHERDHVRRGCRAEDDVVFAQG